jgi:hypothetical protein
LQADRKGEIGMLRRTTLVMALVAGALLAGLAAPANAIEDDPTLVKPLQTIRPGLTVGRLGWATINSAPTPEARCERSSSGRVFPYDYPYHYWFTGVAYYGDVPGSPGFRQWTLFRYRIDGIGEIGDHNNVTMRLSEAGTPKMEVESGDDRRPGVWYEIRPTSPAYTRAGSAEAIVFDVIFDRPRRGDPRCTAITGRA